jgi:hypothetical protein
VDEPPSVAQGGKGVVVPGCPACKKRIATMSRFLDHLTDDVLPPLLDRLALQTKLRLQKNIETPGLQFVELARNCKEYDLFEIGRRHLSNPGVVVGSEARFLLQGMNFALHLRYLLV